MGGGDKKAEIPWKLTKSIKDIYPDAISDLPSNTPQSHGISIQICCYINVDHTGDKVTRRSQTRMLIYSKSVKNISWFSKTKIPLKIQSTNQSSLH